MCSLRCRTGEGRELVLASLTAPRFLEQVDARLSSLTLKIIEPLGLLDKAPEVMKSRKRRRGSVSLFLD
jgi:hypothetical protein